MSKPVKVAKRTSPPAFLAAIFQTAWIRPARMTSASDDAGTMGSVESGHAATDMMHDTPKLIPRY
jgi:hypothetical protein